MSNDNLSISLLLHRIALLMELREDNPFRRRAFERASETIGSLGDDLRDVRARDELTALPGIGDAIAEVIGLALDHQPIPLFDELNKEFPKGVVDLLEISGVGPKLAAKLYKDLGIDSAEALEIAAKDGRLAQLPRVGDKNAASILRNIEAMRNRSGRTPLSHAIGVVDIVYRSLSDDPSLQGLTAAGSFRRCQETVGDLDFVASSSAPEQVMDTFAALPLVKDVLGKGLTKTSIRTSEGLQIDLRLGALEDAGSLLQHFTGSAGHNVRLREYAVARGYKVSEYGVHTPSGDVVHCATERDVYAALGLAYIAPELRQGLDEIELAAAGALPVLVELPEIRGDLHMHTTASDGSNSLQEMIDGCRAKGYAYCAIADHSVGRAIAGGLSIDRLRARIDEIATINSHLTDFRVLTASEVDIKADGSLDYPDDVLAQLDVVVASIHSAMSQDRETATRRLISAMDNPNVDIIGHPSTRLVGKREPMDIDRTAVFAAAARTGTALEVNAHPERLDLKDSDVRLALEAGCHIVIDTDAHSISDLDLMQYGVGTARRGRATPDAVLNTRTLKDLTTWLRRSR